VEATSGGASRPARGSTGTLAAHGAGEERRGKRRHPSRGRSDTLLFTDEHIASIVYQKCLLKEKEVETTEQKGKRRKRTPQAQARGT
jgi:hypothetical protein